MERKKSNFEIINFSDYKYIPNQYTDEFIKKNRCVKFSEDDNTVCIVVSEGYEEKVENLEDIHYPKKIEKIITKHEDFVEFVGTHIDQKVEVKGKEEKNNLSLTEINSEAPIVNIINSIFLEAVRKSVSDIHINCDHNYIRVRFRIDGVLQNVKNLDKKIFNLIVSRIKVMANLNVMENRLCQDGRITVSCGDKKLDFRVSIVPTTMGQSIVLRLFNKDSGNLKLEDLGFSNESYRILEKSLNLPYGMILATGPTGSGKTTTLHSLMEKMDKQHLKIVSIEDPVEEVIDGIE